MQIERARELAAQAWCQEKTAQTEMDVHLAEEFAKILVAEVAQEVERLREVNAELHAELSVTRIAALAKAEEQS